MPHKDSETLESRGPPVWSPPGIPDFTGCVYRIPVAGAGHYDSPRESWGAAGDQTEMAIKDQGDIVSVTHCGTSFMST